MPSSLCDSDYALMVPPVPADSYLGGNCVSDDFSSIGKMGDILAVLVDKSRGDTSSGLLDQITYRRLKTFVTHVIPPLDFLNISPYDSAPGEWRIPDALWFGFM